MVPLVSTLMTRARWCLRRASSEFSSAASVGRRLTLYSFRTLDYIVPSNDAADSTSHSRQGYRVDQIPDDEQVQEKVYLLDHFEQYMANKLYTGQSFTYEDLELQHGMVFLAKYWRMKYVIAFRLSNDVLQVSYHVRCRATNFRLIPPASSISTTTPSLSSRRAVSSSPLSTQTTACGRGHCPSLSTPIVRQKDVSEGE